MRENKISAILNDPSVRNWVKSQYRATLDHDPIDMLEDAELFMEMMKERVNEALRQSR